MCVCVYTQINHVMLQTLQRMKGVMDTVYFNHMSDVAAMFSHFFNG